jgi:hypothetical protein
MSSYRLLIVSQAKPGGQSCRVSNTSHSARIVDSGQRRSMNSCEQLEPELASRLNTIGHADGPLMQVVGDAAFAP